jgi:arsenite oxidase small subunit
MQEKQNARRGFLKAAAGMTAAAVAAPALLASQNSNNGTFYGYEDKTIGSLSKLKSGGEMDFNYPDADSPCKAVMVDGKIKAYSLLCTHKGCPILYNASQVVRLNLFTL